MAGGSSYPVVIHQDRPSKDSASVNSIASQSSAAKSRPSSIASIDSYNSADSTSMWSDKEKTALIDGTKTRFNKQTGQLVTVWNTRS